MNQNEVSLCLKPVVKFFCSRQQTRRLLRYLSRRSSLLHRCSYLNDSLSKGKVPLQFIHLEGLEFT